MRPISLSARDRRALTLGARAIVPLLLILGVVRPTIVGVAAEREALARERASFARESLALRRAPGWVGAAAVLERRRDSLEAHAFAGPDALTAAAALARYVLDTAGETLRLEIAASRAAEDSSGWTQLAVDARGTGDLPALLALLTRLEGSDRLAGVERLTIERRDPSLLDDDDAPLAFTMSIRSVGRVVRATERAAGGAP